MTDRLVALALTPILALCFVALGELILWRSSSKLWQLNQALLIGLIASSAALFPLSLMLRRHALIVLLIGLILGFFLRLWMLKFWALSFTFGKRLDFLSGFFVLWIAGGLSLFALSQMTYSYAWDGYQIWATKAQILYYNGGLTKDFLVSNAPDRLASYPPMVPLSEALLAKISGAFHVERLKPLFILYFCSLAIAVYYSARQMGSSRFALGITALVVTIPGLGMGTNVGGYADMPQAVILAAFVGAALESPGQASRSPLPWLLGGLPFVKNEGFVMYWIACAMILLFWISDTRTPFLARLRRNATAISLAAVLALLRLGYLQWVGVADPSFPRVERPILIRALCRIPEVARLCLGEMLNWRHWAIVWPLFLLAAIYVAVYLRGKIPLVAFGTVLTLIAYGSIYLFTNWTVKVHLDNSFDRLLAQLIPAALVTLGAAFRHAVRERAPANAANS